MRIPKNSLILGKNQYYDLNDRQTHVNNNVIIVGSPGSGKTRSIVIPNLLMAEGSYVISDPKGNLCDTYGPYLESKGYEVKRLDFVNPKQSIHYNPLRHISNEQDILKLATILATTTNVGDYNRVDPIWPNSSVLLYSALIAYVRECLFESEHTLRTVFEMLSMADGSANAIDSGQFSDFDLLFMSLKEKQEKSGLPKSFAVKQYEKVKSCTGRTFRSIVITALSVAGRFDTQDLNEMMSCDDLEIKEIGRKKTAFFVVVSDTDRSMDTLANMFFMQAISELCMYADNECEGNHLPIPVRFIMDDFATNCKVNDFPRMIASFRSRWISTILILQAESQLIEGYGNDGRTILGSCDSYVYLGGNDLDTSTAVSGKSGYSLREVYNMPVGQCIILRRGEEPIMTEIFPLEDMEEYQQAMRLYHLYKKGVRFDGTDDFRRISFSYNLLLGIAIW